MFKQLSNVFGIENKICDQIGNQVGDRVYDKVCGTAFQVWERVYELIQIQVHLTFWADNEL